MCAIKISSYILQSQNGLSPLQNLRNPVKAADFPKKELRALTGY